MIELVQTDQIDGRLHRPAEANGSGIVLSHGAGANCDAPLLVSLSSALETSGVTVLRCNLKFRQQRASGPPFRGSGPADRDGLRRAADWLREQVDGPIYVGGHSYGGRQASILAADNAGIADGLVLLSYPLHPPRQPGQLRTEHFPSLRTRTFFVQGTRDPFGSPQEMQAAIALIPGAAELKLLEGAGHDLKGDDRLSTIAGWVLGFMSLGTGH